MFGARPRFIKRGAFLLFFREVVALATIPSVPTEPAGIVSTSADWNGWGTANSFLLGSASGQCPIFFLMAAGASQTFTSTATPVNWSNSAPVFKDNDSGWSSGTPSVYTIKTQGYWTFEYTVNSGASAGNSMFSYIQVVTTASNPYNPSATVQFCYVRAPQTTLNACNCGASLCPIALFPGDTVQVYAATTTSSTEGTSPNSSFTGQWVSM